MVSCFTINCTTEICRRRKCLLLLNLFRTSHKGLEYKKSLGSSNNNRDRCYLSRCDWKLWLDKVTNKVLRSVCSSQFSPLSARVWVSSRVRTLLRFTDTSLGVRETERRTIKRSRLMAYFVWTTDESHIWASAANQRAGPGPLTNQKLGNCHHFPPITIGLRARKMVQIK